MIMIMIIFIVKKYNTKVQHLINKPFLKQSFLNMAIFQKLLLPYQKLYKKNIKKFHCCRFKLIFGKFRGIIETLDLKNFIFEVWHIHHMFEVFMSKYVNCLRKKENNANISKSPLAVQYGHLERKARKWLVLWNLLKQHHFKKIKSRIKIILKH